MINFNNYMKLLSTFQSKDSEFFKSVHIFTTKHSIIQEATDSYILFRLKNENVDKQHFNLLINHDGLITQGNKYPNIDRLIPIDQPEYHTNIKLPEMKLLETVCKNNKKEIISFSKDGTIKATINQNFNNMVEQGVKLTISNDEINISPDLLLKVLQILVKEKKDIEISFYSPVKPIMIKQGNLTILITPIRRG